jgi:hypothetical protein
MRGITGTGYQPAVDEITSSSCKSAPAGDWQIIKKKLRRLTRKVVVYAKIRSL